MRFPPRRFSSPAVSRRAFTLIELLVVISIIAILAGLLLPVGQRVVENARKVTAKSTLTQVVAAIKQYQSDYGTYPVVAAPGTPADTTYDTSKHNGEIFGVLRATNTTGPTVGLNPRRIVYFEYHDAKNPVAPKDGFVPATATSATSPFGGALTAGDLVDPWGSQYCFRMDTGYTDRVVDPIIDASPGADDSSTTSDATLLHMSVIGWSIGSKGMMAKTAATFDTLGDVGTWR